MKDISGQPDRLEPNSPHPRYHDVVYDWNLVDTFHDMENRQVALLDETLRDGLQSPSLTAPSAEERLNLVRLMASLGITTANIGLPGAGPQARADCLFVARGVVSEGLNIRLAAAARTLENDIAPIVEISQATGVSIEVMSFIGSSPIRLLAEDWDLPFLLKRSREAISFGRREGLPVTFVTEDTTRSRPDVLYRLFTNAVEAGCQRLCICDTTGHATPDGIRALMRFVRDLLKGIGVEVGLDWHGHNDRGMALANSLWAIQWGADRIHGCALGVGERCGNTPMDQLIMNLRLLGSISRERDLNRLLEYCEFASKILGFPIPPNYPLAGRDAFRTQTGVHAAAIRKALNKGDSWLADRVYSGVPAGMFGRAQEVCVGPMSGASNVHFVLERLGIPADDATVAQILARAKKMDRILTDDEVLAAAKGEDAENECLKEPDR